MADRPTIGVLALQGNFREHARMLRRLAVDVVEVRKPAQLAGLDGLVIPGGESTTMTLGIDRERLAEPLRELVRAGTPVLGTCAGMIMLDRDHLGVLDVRCERNAFGRQVRSFEAELEAFGRAVFIRAPWVAEAGPDVEVLAEVDGHPVAVRQGRVLACAFHPELTDDSRLHALLMAMATSARDERRAAEDPSDTSSTSPR